MTVPLVIALARIVFSNSSGVNPSRLRKGGNRKSEDLHITKQHLFAQNISEMCLVAFKDGFHLNFVTRRSFLSQEFSKTESTFYVSLLELIALVWPLLLVVGAREKGIQEGQRI